MTLLGIVLGVFCLIFLVLVLSQLSKRRPNGKSSRRR